MKKNVTIRYFALVGARRGTQTEPYATEAETADWVRFRLRAARVMWPCSATARKIRIWSSVIGNT